MSFGLSSVGDYQHGDRVSGVRYSVVNFVPGTGGSKSEYRLQRVGSWHSEMGYIPCSKEGFLQGALTGEVAGSGQWAVGSG